MHMMTRTLCVYLSVIFKHNFRNFMKTHALRENISNANIESGRNAWAQIRKST